MTWQTPLKLGLIGDNIAQSQAPRLHHIAAEQNGIAVIYNRLVPRELGQDFDGVFDSCLVRGYRGINITYPYKERAAARMQIDDPAAWVQHRLHRFHGRLPRRAR